MKIVQMITRGDTYYGAQAHVLDMCKLLKADGQDVVAVVGNEGDLTDRFTDAGVPYRVVPTLQRAIHPTRDLRSVTDLKNLFLEIKPDLVATHSSKAGIVGRLGAYRAGVPCVFTAHGWSFEDGIPYFRRKLYLAIERYVARRTNRIIGVSELGRQLGIDNRVAPADKIETIYYGVEDIGPQHVRELNDPFTMTMVAGFRNQKDHPTLIAALEGLKDRSWQVHFLGDGPLMETTRQQVQQAGLADRIHFHGAVKNVPEYLRKTHLKVLITNWEGLPISVLESLSYGMPVVASDVSGVSEEVIDGYNGLLTQRGDVDSVKTALAKMMDSPQLCEEYGANSRNLFEEHFTQEAMYKKTKSLYERVIAEA